MPPKKKDTVSINIRIPVGFMEYIDSRVEEMEYASRNHGINLLLKDAIERKKEGKE